MPSPQPPAPETTPADLRALLTQARTIAVVGASGDRGRASFGVMGYLQRAGYRTIPVNPTALGGSVHGERFRGSLREIEERIDIVDVFRRSDAIDDVVDEAIAAGAPVLWLQLGIRNPAAALRAEAAGIRVVANRCISVEHSRLVG